MTGVLSSLEELFASQEFEKCGYARMEAIECEGDALTVLLAVAFPGSDAAPQKWQVVCGDVRVYRLCEAPIDVVELTSSHPLLLPYTAPSTALNFVGVPQLPRAVVGDLWQAHHDITDGWFAFETFLNPGMPPVQLLASGGGVLGEGRRPILEAYAAVLVRHGLRVAWVGEREPTAWRDQRPIPERPDLQVLLLGESYIVGADWDDARRLA